MFLALIYHICNNCKIKGEKVKVVLKWTLDMSLSIM